MVTGKGHGGLSQNRKRRVIGKDYVEKGQRRRAGKFHWLIHAWSSMAIPRWPSARLTPLLRGLTDGLKQNTGQWQTNDVCWLLRFCVLRETSMTSAMSIPFQKSKM
jgi:hypothetical protein